MTIPLLIVTPCIKGGTQTLAKHFTLEHEQRTAISENLHLHGGLCTGLAYCDGGLWRRTDNQEALGEADVVILVKRKIESHMQALTPIVHLLARHYPRYFSYQGTPDYDALRRFLSRRAGELEADADMVTYFETLSCYDPNREKMD